MKVIRLSDGVREAAEQAADFLRNGGVVLYPTDTLYALGVDALSDAAVDQMYAIKGRELGKPTHAIVADLAMAEKYAEFNDMARKLADRFWPGPLTMILKKKPEVQIGIGRGIETIGIRIPKSDFCLELARAFGKPITTPSANRAGHGPFLSPREVIADIGEEHIDLFVDAGTLEQHQASTIVDVSSGNLVILREGAIPKERILEP